jgi:hypothetical protein
MQFDDGDGAILVVIDYHACAEKSALKYEKRYLLFMVVAIKVCTNTHVHVVSITF